MATETTNFGFILPAVNSPTDADLWGGELNSNINEQDALFLTALNFVTSAPTTSFSVTPPTIGSSTTGNAKEAFLCNASSGALDVTLPAATAAGNGYTIAFKKSDNSINVVTLTVTGSDKIDGSSTYVLSSQYAWLFLVCDGSSNWNVFSTNVGFAALASPAFTGTPTAPTPSSDDSSTKIATTAFVNPSSSIIANGFEKTASGKIQQWGLTTSIGSGTFTTVDYPEPFPNSVYNIQITPTSVTNGFQAQDYVINNSLSSFDLHNQGASSTIFFWQAIGN